jgi:hypothetical protein
MCLNSVIYQYFDDKYWNPLSFGVSAPVSPAAVAINIESKDTDYENPKVQGVFNA